MPTGPQKRSAGTRAALLAAARPLFAERGFATVSADEIVAAAALTRGALHHHFGDKQGLFREVFIDLERVLGAEVRAAAAAHQDPAAQMAAALDCFLAICVRPEVVRIALTDAPGVLGWQQWRAIEAEHGLGLVIDLLDQAMSAGVVTQTPVRTLAHLIMSAAVEAALLIAHAPDQATARADARQALATLLAGLLIPPVPGQTPERKKPRGR